MTHVTNNALSFFPRSKIFKYHILIFYNHIIFDFKRVIISFIILYIYKFNYLTSYKEKSSITRGKNDFASMIAKCLKI